MLLSTVGKLAIHNQLEVRNLQQLCYIHQPDMRMLLHRPGFMITSPAAIYICQCKLIAKTSYPQT